MRRLANNLLLLGIIVSAPFTGAAFAEDCYLTLSTTLVGRFALGSPATFEGYVADTPVNPAGFNLFSQEYAPKFKVFFNPLGSAVAAESMNFGEDSDGKLEGKDLFLPLILFFKGFNFSFHPFELGISLAEQPQSGIVGGRPLEYFPLFDHYSNRMFLQFELHEKVALGLSAEFFCEAGKVRGVGWSYGVLIKPGKVSVGVFYYLLPFKYRNELLARDRIVEDTVNAGLAWQPFRFLKCYLDLRNLSEENSPAFLEPHLGLETLIWEHTALRAGYYREENESHAFTIGLGLLDLNVFRSLDEKSVRREFLLDYTFSILPEENRLHALAIHFRL